VTLTRTGLVQWVQEKMGGEELKTVRIDSHNDVVSRIEEQGNKALAMRESRIIGLWLSEKAEK